MQPAQAAQYFNWWFGNTTSGFLSVGTIGQHGARFTSFDRRSGLDEIAEYAVTVGEHDNTYVRLTTLADRPEPRKRGGGRDSKELLGLALDIDGSWGQHKHRLRDLRLPATAEEALAPLEVFPPSVLINSGGGFYALWRFVQPVVDVDAQVEILARWTAFWKGRYGAGGLHVDNISDLARVIRPPGTFNHKFSPPRPVEVMAGGSGADVEVGDVLALCPPLPERGEREQVRFDGSPFDAVRCPEGHRYLADRLISELDWSVTPPYDDDDMIHVLRPGSESTKSMTIGGSINGEPAAGQVQMWSDAVEELPSGPYSVGQVLTRLLHDGDAPAAAQRLSEDGFGEWTEAEERLDPTDFLALSGVTDPWSRLSGDWWESRPLLSNIRQAAVSAGASPDAVIDTVMSRVASSLPHTLEIPGINGAPSALNLYSCIVGPSGVGKSSSVSTAERLAPLPYNVKVEPLGTGEGLTENFIGEIEVTDEDGKKKKQRAQVEHNLWVNVDEGRVLVDLEQRDGATLGETLRRAWTGQMLGQGNASQERRRKVEQGQYSFGMVMGIQVQAAALMFSSEHVDLGTAQRWLLSPAGRAPQPRPRPPRPPWPTTPQGGPFKVMVSIDPRDLQDVEEVRAWTDGKRRRHVLSYDPRIVAEMQTYHDDKMEGYITIDPLDSHEPLHLLKIAGLLAVLDGRLHVNMEDWQLAKERWSVHRENRAVLLKLAREERRREAEEIVSARVRERIALSQVDRIDELADLLTSQLRDAGPQDPEAVALWIVDRKTRDRLAKDIITRMLERGLARREDGKLVAA